MVVNFEPMVHQRTKTKRWANMEYVGGSQPGITDRIEVGGCSIGRQLNRKGGSGTSDKEMCEFFD